MADLLGSCCPAAANGTDAASGGGGLDGGSVGSGSEFCTQALPAALAPDRPPSADLCHLPPISCTPEGRLRQLALPGGLDCFWCVGEGMQMDNTYLVRRQSTN
jgi:hypothetical protein